MRPPLNIAFVHPDLGLGGAERLVVEAACCLQEAGHRVVIFTSHHDPTRCFEPTRDGTLRVRVHGDFLPFSVLQRLRAPCAIARMSCVAGMAALQRDRFDIVFGSAASHVIPLLRLATQARIIFYCHWPDMLLTPQRDGLYRWYRAPLDRLEAIGMRMADRVLVNSEFTAARVRQTFPQVPPEALEVLYPGVDCEQYARGVAHSPTAEDLIVCISRYERKKNLALAIKALAALRETLGAAAFARVQLVIAGGFDPRLDECAEVLRSLEALAQSRGLQSQVHFLRSPTEAQRMALLSQCRCVVYTPSDEHFGYVPVEAMAAGRPVVAVGSGGPLETVVAGETGFLCAPEPRAFAAALAYLLTNSAVAEHFGNAGRVRVAERFSRRAFRARLVTVVDDVVTTSRRDPAARPSILE